ncbi:LiaF transmembrane domain-containing protein [Desulfosporosinus nitroreducens]|uniref:DUF5668 domain-containing protein n=1 Tax=Desulfosporosinus nitroreducens TaxID=2018668 RepID=A0ABT8QQQ6_9FIRM|nr:DUF5668 domain-containing protein [Desulfosporosinus nitroreducens]MCO1599981.1 DUF5668 domain-containing protein [Desulfosporosinus nitroreducens]MDO0822975.1 DUF5668 domain-containing protein [Desulfosporosinus nitroreducens]
MKRVFDSVSRGLLLITMGVIFFLLNYGFLSWNLWAHVLDLWPLILILAGIGLLFNRRIPLSAILLIFLLSMVGYSLVVGDKPVPWRLYNSFHSNLREAEAIEVPARIGGSGSIDVPLPSEVKKAQLNLELGGAQFQVKALENNQSQAQLMTGSYRWERRGSAPTVNGSPIVIEQSGDTINAKLSSSTPGIGTRNFKDISLNLSQKVHYDFDIEAGAINGDINLSQLFVDKFKISTGASELKIQFGDLGSATDGEIESGASKLTLVVPEATGLKIRLNGVATSTNFMGSGLLLEDKDWVSPNYAEAKSKIDLEISTAAGTLRLERPSNSIL